MSKTEDKLYDLEQRFNALYASLATYVSNQASVGDWDIGGSWQDYGSGQWAAITFTVPPSGAVEITVTGTTVGTNGYGYIGWRISGTDTVGNANRHCFGGVSGGTVRTGRTTVVSGLTAGASDTVTPTWYGAAGNSDSGDGQLTVRPAWVV